MIIFHRSRQTGFTLIELMISIAILAILAMIAYPSYNTYVQKARLENARASMLDAIQLMERQYAQKHTFSGANISSITNEKYDLSLVSTTPSNFILVATPKANLYSNDTLSKIPLNLFYASQSATFAKCTTAGLTAAKSATGATTGCEPS